MDPADRFASHATAFRDWAVHGTDTGSLAARSALLHITRLYLAALALPQSDQIVSSSDAERIGRDGWEQVYRGMARLPFQYYSDVSDPLTVPGELPDVGDVADDLADIFADVEAGLRVYETGNRAGAARDWGYWMALHWGGHATAAIRVLHRWLAANDPNGLSQPG